MRTQTVAALTQAVRTAPRTTTTQALTVQEISAAVSASPGAAAAAARVTTASSSGSNSSSTSATSQQVISTATLTPAQLVAAQRSATVSTGKSFGPVHTERRAPPNRHTQIVEHTVATGVSLPLVHTKCVT